MNDKNEKHTAADLAGHCNEPTAWRILKEVSEEMMSQKTLEVSPYHIAINGDGSFSLMQPEKSIDMSGFEAPEAVNGNATDASSVWSLAASLFYVVMGCQVMNGKGGRGQNEQSKVPYMRSEWSQLSELVQNCLHFRPECRPSMHKLHDVAAKEFQRCMEMIRRGPKFRERPTKNFTAPPDSLLAFWPESMQPAAKTNTHDY